MINIREVSKHFGSVSILENVNLEILQGQSCAVVGASGSGKTTLLNIASLLDKPSSGQVFYFEKPIAKAEFLQFRKKNIAFVYQQHNLLPEFSVLENIEIVAKLRGTFQKGEAESLLKKVGLASYVNAKIYTLSGGQKQRVAIVRAICAKPKIIFADEPTGNLDVDSATECLDLLFNIMCESGISLFLITHNLDIAKKCDLKKELKNKTLIDL